MSKNAKLQFQSYSGCLLPHDMMAGLSETMHVKMFQSYSGCLLPHDVMPMSDEVHPQDVSILLRMLASPRLGIRMAFIPPQDVSILLRMLASPRPICNQRRGR